MRKEISSPSLIQSLEKSEVYGLQGQKSFTGSSSLSLDLKFEKNRKISKT